MKRLVDRLALAVLAAISCAACAPMQTPARARQVELPDGARLVKIEPFQLLMLGAAGPPCPDDGTPCEITMRIIPVNGRRYCLAEARDVAVKTVTGGGGNPKAVVWKLSTDTLDGKRLVFHPDAGIIITADRDKQIDPKGGYGNGPGHPNPPKDRYYVKTKRDKLGAKSSYLPVVLWGPEGDEELCAAVDPKIVNV